MWPNFQNHHGRIFPAQRTARGICPQHVDGLGVKTDEMRVVQSHSHGWAYGLDVINHTTAAAHRWFSFLLQQCNGPSTASHQRAMDFD